MRLPDRIRRFLLARAARLASTRLPDFVIGPGGNDAEDYLRRWWVIPRNRFFNVYLHNFRRSDDDRALHDHPWWNVSILLSGAYTEHTIAAGGVNRRIIYRAGDIKPRGAKSAHRVELHAGPVWTLFITGPVLRAWGFHCPAGWRPWQQFVDGRDSGKIGRGCD